MNDLTPELWGRVLGTALQQWTLQDLKNMRSVCKNLQQACDDDGDLWDKFQLVWRTDMAYMRAPRNIVLQPGDEIDELMLIGTMVNLRTLNLAGTDLSNFDLQHLDNLSLTHLDIGDTNITEDGITILAESGHPLFTLILWNCPKLSLNSMRTIAQFPFLEELDIEGTKTSGAWLYEFRQAETPLRKLDLAYNNVCDAQLYHLTFIPTLRELNLRGTRVGNEGVKILTKMKLSELVLGETNISDACIMNLAQICIASLTFLDIEQTPITADGMAQLRELVGPDKPIKHSTRQISLYNQLKGDDYVCDSSIMRDIEEAELQEAIALSETFGCQDFGIEADDIPLEADILQAIIQMEYQEDLRAKGISEGYDEETALQLAMVQSAQMAVERAKPTDPEDEPSSSGITEKEVFEHEETISLTQSWTFNLESESVKGKEAAC